MRPYPKNLTLPTCIMLVMLLAAHVAQADTTWVSTGNIYGAWSTAGSPYMISTGHVTVPTDCTLTIEAGTKIVFTGPYEFVVNGRLRGEGVQGDSIRFTCDTLVTPSGWRGLRFLVANDLSYLQYAIIENGRAIGVNIERYGGGLEIDSCDVTLQHCTIRNNRSLLEGGGVYMHDYANPAFEDCVIENNHSNTRGGGIAGRVRVEPILRDCRISNNSAALDGGALYMDYRANPYMVSCVVAGNTATNRGAGLFLTARRWIRQTYILNCLWYDNRSNFGGAFSADSSELVIDFSTFAMNQSLFGSAAIQAAGCSLVVDNTIFAHHSTGAIEHVLAQLSVRTSCFFNDGPQPIVGVAPPGFGVFSQINLLEDSVDEYFNTFSDPAFVDTASSDFRLSIDSRVVSIAIPPTLNDLLVDQQGNPRPSPAGAPPDMGALENSFHLPHAFLCGELDGTIPAGIYIVPCDIEIREGANVILEPGAQLLFAGEFGINVSGSLQAAGTEGDSVYFGIYPTHTGNWSGLHLADAQAASSFSYCVFEGGGTDTSRGGAITISRSGASLNNCLFRDNRGVGGVIHVSADSVSLVRCTFSENEAPGLYLEHGGNAYLWECAFDGTAGGVFLRSNAIASVNLSSFMRLIEPAFINTESASLRIFDCSIRNGHANSCGMAVHGGQVTVGTTEFSNDSTGSGSVISLTSGETSFTRCAFDSCGSVITGGGVISVSGSAIANFDSCTFFANSAISHGGSAVRVADDEASANIERCWFEQNSVLGAQSFGGTVYIAEGFANIERSVFLGNSGGRGGALYLDSTQAEVHSNVFYQNSAAFGAGLYINRANPDIADNVVNESIGGPGITFWDDCSMANVHHNAWLNSLGDIGFQDDLVDYGPPAIGVLDSVNLNGDAVDTYGNIFVDPQFVDPTVDNFLVLPTSPCVNAGSPFAGLDPDSSIRDIGLSYSPVPYAPPTAFTLAQPLNGSIVVGEQVEVKWRRSFNPDNSAIPLYLVEAANNSQFERPYLQSLSHDTLVTIAALNGLNYWRVTAFSSDGIARRCNAAFTFTRPYALTPFDLLEPITGFPQPVNWPVHFSWQHSIDPDGIDTITYRMQLWAVDGLVDVPLDTANQATITLSNLGFVSGDQVRWSIFAHSIDPDTSIESLSRNWLFLTDSATSDIREHAIITEFRLYPAYPNPFNAQVTLEYDLPYPVSATLRIFDATGREVETFSSASGDSGRHRIFWDASRHSTGAYFARLEAGEFTEVQKLFLLK